MRQELQGLSLEGAVCAGCGCLCDDIGLEFREGTLVRLHRACPMGETWIRSLRPPGVEAFVGGRPASTGAALDAAQSLLAEAFSPAIAGLLGLTLEAIIEAARLGEEINAPLVPFPVPPAGLRRSGIDAPECSATLGEVRGTADVVVFWRADPLRTHPRHLERFTLEPPLIDGRNRVLVLVDDSGAASETAPRADLCLTLESGLAFPAADLDCVRALRLLLEKRESEGDDGTRHATVLALARRLEGARHVHFVLGDEAAASPVLWNAFQLLAARSRQSRRVTVGALPGPGNWRGVLEVLSWQTGGLEPAMDLVPLLEAGAADLLVAAGLDAAELPDRARRAFEGLRRIVIGPEPDPAAAVSIRVPGLDPRLSASIVRSDGIHLTLDGRDPAGRGVPDPAAALLADLAARAAPGAALHTTFRRTR